MLANKVMGATSAAPDLNYIEDVFSTYLYTGNGSTQTINNGIDLAGKGGLVWFKPRNTANNHNLIDSARGLNKFLISNDAAANGTTGAGYGVASFNSTGFSLNPPWTSSTNTTDTTYASWTFRKQPKFFDVVTYTGTGNFDEAVPHNLGAVPAVIIIKCTNAAADWIVRTNVIDGSNDFLFLNTTAAKSDSSVSNSTSTTFRTGGGLLDGASGNTYVAYLFASNAGGFGLSGNENVISCGSATTDGAGKATIDLGYEPQWVLVKDTSGANGADSGWFIMDTMRGFVAPLRAANNTWVFANTSGAETNGISNYLSSTGFSIGLYPTTTYIYIAIRRGPMKVPTDGTKVFDLNFYSNPADGVPPSFKSSALVDAALRAYRPGAAGSSYPYFASRLTGTGQLGTSSSGAELTSGGNKFDYMNGWGSNAAVTTDTDNLSYMFRRAPSFFDEVCFTLPGATTATYSHNLTIAPELMIVKTRGTVGNWLIYHKDLGTSAVLYLNGDFPAGTGSDYWSTTPTATQFSLNNANLWGNTTTSVAFLFATCAGISKVGSYTGTGTTQAIACGFTAGARFVMIKRTDAAGDWYVWDSARGIVAGNDPYLLLNSQTAEVTNTDYIDPSSAGFEISSTAPAAINASGGSYIFLAVA